jgi:hypothetical protein
MKRYDKAIQAFDKYEFIEISNDRDYSQEKSLCFMIYIIAREGDHA